MSGEAATRQFPDTGPGHLARLQRPGCRYFNLNPYEVLDLPYDADNDTIKKTYRRISLMVHPDKNPDVPAAKDVFDAVSKAYKSLVVMSQHAGPTPSLPQDEEARGVVDRIVAESKKRVEDEYKKQKKEKDKDGKTLMDQMGLVKEEDYTQTEEYRNKMRVLTCKLFMEVEVEKEKLQQREFNERAREAEKDKEEKTKRKKEEDHDKEWEESREGRVGTWRDFTDGSHKRPKGMVKLPTKKLETKADVKSAAQAASASVPLMRRMA
eukprot:tig00000142_g8642.t1